MKKMTALFLSLLIAVLATSCGGDDPVTGMPPSITLVSWVHPSGCVANTASDVNITVAASDPDNMANELSYSGSFVGCTGTLTAASGTINCPQLAPYNCSVTVSDPDGNSDTQTFTIGVCTDGSAP